MIIAIRQRRDTDLRSLLSTDRFSAQPVAMSVHGQRFSVLLDRVAALAS